MLNVKKLLTKICEAIKGQCLLDDNTTGTATLHNCTGTISHNQITFYTTKSGLLYVSGRVNINSFTRTGGNPGVVIALPNNVPTPTLSITYQAGIRAQEPREAAQLAFTANSRNVYITTTESFANAANGTLTLVVECMVVLKI